MLAAAGGGALWGLCHGREPFWPLAWLALIPLLSLCGQPTGRRAFFLGWLHGVVAWLVGIPWIAFTLGVYGGLPAPLSYVLLLLLTLYLGLYHGLFALLGHGLWRRGGVFAALGLPALWVALEVVQGSLFGGFPWNLAAYAWTQVPGALPFAAWGGAFGVSFLVLAANTGLALAIRGGLRQRWRPAGAGLAALLLPVVLLALAAWRAGPEVEAPPAPPAPFRIVQPNISMDQTSSWEGIEAGYQRLLSLSREACDEAGALVLWPESAGFPLRWEGDGNFPGRMRRDLEALAARGCPVLFNSVYETAGPGAGAGVYNSAFLLSPGGNVQRYDKRHLVPWGEYVPLARLFPFVGKLARNAGNFVPGTEPGNLSWAGTSLGLGVCYESVFPAEVAQSVRAGATVLATLSNDAWYGDSAARKQLFRAVRFRAAENRRPLLRAAITGISALIAPDGRVIRSLDLDRTGVLRGSVAGRSDLTLFTRWPGLVPWASILGAAFAIIAAWRKPS